MSLCAILYAPKVRFDRLPEGVRAICLPPLFSNDALRIRDRPPPAAYSQPWNATASSARNANPSEIIATVSLTFWSIRGTWPIPRAHSRGRLRSPPESAMPAGRSCRPRAFPSRGSRIQSPAPSKCLDVVEIENLGRRKARLAYLPEAGQHQPHAAGPEHVPFPDQRHDAQTMRRQRGFQDDGRGRQDRHQENRAHEVHRIYSLRRKADRQRADRPRLVIYPSHLAFSRWRPANPRQHHALRKRVAFIVWTLTATRSRCSKSSCTAGPDFS
jgi:hypothetical protein